MSDTQLQGLVVHLIHGTWPEGGWLSHRLARLTGRVIPAPWLQDGSSFRSELLASFPPSHRISFDTTFNWRGRNSVTERVAGARALREHLATAIDCDPQSEHLIVAHSHGGNVALDAVRALTPIERQRVAGVVCLATPFLHTEPRAMAGRRTLNAGIESVFFAVSLVTAVFLLIFVEALVRNGFKWETSGLIGLPSPVTYLELAGGLTVTWLIMRWIRRTRAQVAGSSQGASLSEFQILAIHAPADEAYRGMVAAETLAVLCAAPFQLILLTARWVFGPAVLAPVQAFLGLKLRWIVLFAVAYGAAALILTDIGISGNDPSRAAAYLDGLGTLMRRAGALWFLANLSYVPAQVLLSAAYGVEAMAADGPLRPQVESAPVGCQSTVWVLEATADWAGARHSIALHPGAAAGIARWFASVVETRGSSRLDAHD